MGARPTRRLVDSATGDSSVPVVATTSGSQPLTSPWIIWFEHALRQACVEGQGIALVAAALAWRRRRVPASPRRRVPRAGRGWGGGFGGPESREHSASREGAEGKC